MNKWAESKTPAKSFSRHHINNLPMNSHDSIIHLQQTVGNQAIQKLMRSDIKFDFAKIGIQPKLKVSHPGDVYEQEADRVAERIMRMSSSDHDSRTVSNEARIDHKRSACEMKAVSYTHLTLPTICSV